MKKPPKSSDPSNEDDVKYRKLPMNYFFDDRYRSLSPVQPSGQSLYIHMLTGPHTTSLPGLFNIGRSAMAETLRWSPEAFEKAFQELYREGFAKADWEALVVWSPEMFRVNRPANPKVIMGWKSFWSRIPNCGLKLEAYDAIFTVLIEMKPSFLDAFLSSCDKPVLSSLNCTPNGSGNRLGNDIGNGIENGMPYTGSREQGAVSREFKDPSQIENYQDRALRTGDGSDQGMPDNIVSLARGGTLS